MVPSLLSFKNVLKDITQFFTNTEDFEACSTTAMVWIAIAITLAFVVCKFAVAKDKQRLVNRIFLGIALAFTVTVIILFSVVYFTEDVKKEGDFVPITYYPLMVFALVVAASVIAVLVKPDRIVKICALSLTGAALLATLICLFVYWGSGDAEATNWIDLDAGKNAGLYVSAILLIAGIALIAVFTDKGSKGFDSRSLAFAAVCVALSFALSYVRFLKMPFGGSITFASTFPLMLYSFMFGTRKGVAAGAVYGILQAVQDPWILHPAQFFLDYPVAFAGIGAAGLFRSLGVFKDNMRAQFALGALVAGALRFVSHFFSGAFAFGAGGLKAAGKYGIAALESPYFYSFVYQCMYVIPEIIIVIIVGVILLSSGNLRSQIERYGAHKKTAVPATDVTDVTVESADVSDENVAGENAAQNVTDVQTPEDKN